MRTFPGKVEASKKVELAFQVSGLLVKLPVREGQNAHIERWGQSLQQENGHVFEGPLKALRVRCPGVFGFIDFFLKIVAVRVDEGG